ncbi:MAG: sulfatase [Vicinamibacteria bacterium]
MADAKAVYDPVRFRSVRKVTALSSSVTMAGETQLSLTPPLPSQLTYEVQIPPNPVLRFAIGAMPLGDDTLNVPVDFLLRVNSEAGEEICFSETVRGSRGDRWLDREADLTPWSGKKVSLTFETKLRGNTRARSRENDPPPILAVWGSPVLASSTAENEKPNLVLISIDCLRADHVGAYGYQRNTTPRIDALAKDGVVFETAVSVSSWTLPTHMAMLTGLPPSIHGATRQSKLASSVPYLPELLAQSGYRVDGVVSVPHLSQHFGFERGFHSYLFSFDPGAERLVDAALDVVRRGEGQAQFLFLHLLDVHWPYAAPEDFRTRFGERPSDISDLLSKVLNDEPPRNQEEINQVINLYDGELAYVDRELGRFFDGLKAAKLYERSLIILTADHGEAFYEHGHWKHTQTLYEEMIRVPLIVKWPRESPTGHVKSLVSQIDVFPTVLEGAGLNPPGTWATSLLRHVDRASNEQSRRTVVTEVTWDAIPTRPAKMKVAFRNEEFKYIATLEGPAVNELNAGGVHTEELYNLIRDPSERDNLQPKSDRELRFFREELRAYFAEARALRAMRGGEPVILDETVLEKLRSLGYIDH